MALRGLLRGVPVWLVPGEDPAVGRWLSLDLFLISEPAGSAGSSTRLPGLTDRGPVSCARLCLEGDN